MRPTFSPGMISVSQQTERPNIIDERLASPLYMWKATFKVAELYDIRIKEYESSHSIELLAVCESSPLGQGLVTI